MDELEEWKPILNGVYEITRTGNVRRIKGGKGTQAGRLIQVYKGDHYPYFEASIDGKRSRRYIHQLLYQVFIGPIPDGYEINHIDADKHNNDLSNLEIVTHRENMQHAARLGLMPRITGERHPFAKLTTAQVVEIRQLHVQGMTKIAIARLFNTPERTIRNIIAGRTRIDG